MRAFPEIVGLLTGADIRAAILAVGCGVLLVLALVAVLGVSLVFGVSGLVWVVKAGAVVLAGLILLYVVVSALYRRDDRRFMDAVESRDEALVRERLKRVVRWESLDRPSPLPGVFQDAVSSGDMVMVRLLLEHYVHIIETRDSKGSTALHLAAAKGHEEIVRLLVDLCLEQGVTIKPDDRRHVSRLARDWGNDEIVRLLVEPTHAKDLRRQTPGPGDDERRAPSEA